MRTHSYENRTKSRRRQQRERQQTKGLMSRTMVLHERFDSLYISLPSSAKQQREMTKFYLFCSTRTAMANFSCLTLELNAIITYLAWAGFQTDLNRSTELRHSRVKYKYFFHKASFSVSFSGLPSSMIKLPNVFHRAVHFDVNQTHFHMKGSAPGLVLKQRHKVTRKWPINVFRHLRLTLVIL